MDRTTAERELRALEKRAKADLARLDREKEQIENLVSFVREYTRGGRQEDREQRPRRRSSLGRKTPLLGLIRERPGIRTSMLALATRRSHDDVAAELDRLQGQARIERAGLGWIVSPGDP